MNYQNEVLSNQIFEIETEYGRYTSFFLNKNKGGERNDDKIIKLAGQNNEIKKEEEVKLIEECKVKEESKITEQNKVSEEKKVSEKFIDPGGCTIHIRITNKDVLKEVREVKAMRYEDADVFFIIKHLGDDFKENFTSSDT